MLLAKDPAGRFQSAAAVAELLEQHLAHLDDPALPSPSSVLVGAEPTDQVHPVSARDGCSGPSPKKKAMAAVEMGCRGRPLCFPSLSCR